MDKLKAKELAEEFADCIKVHMLEAYAEATGSKKRYAHINFLPRPSLDFTYWKTTITTSDSDTQENENGITYTFDTVQNPQIMPLWKKDKEKLEESIYNYLLQNKYWPNKK